VGLDWERAADRFNAVADPRYIFPMRQVIRGARRQYLESVTRLLEAAIIRVAMHSRNVRLPGALQFFKGSF
jgi:hypothetical protein